MGELLELDRALKVKHPDDVHRRAVLAVAGHTHLLQVDRDVRRFNRAIHAGQAAADDRVVDWVQHRDAAGFAVEAGQQRRFTVIRQLEVNRGDIVPTVDVVTRGRDGGRADDSTRLVRSRQLRLGCVR